MATIEEFMDMSRSCAELRAVLSMEAAGDPRWASRDDWEEAASSSWTELLSVLAAECRGDP